MKRLPNLSGPLSTIVPASSITAANEEVKSIITTGKERGPYMRFSEEAKLAIARYAAKNGVVASNSLCHFASRFPDLKESSVKFLKNFSYSCLPYCIMDSSGIHMSLILLRNLCDDRLPSFNENYLKQHMSLIA